MFCVCSQKERLGAQVGHLCLVENAQTARQACQVHDRGVRTLEALRTGCGLEVVVHQKAGRLVVAVPALEADVVLVIAVFLVHESSSNRTSSGVHVLVSAPACKVNVPLMKLQFDVSSGVRKIPADSETVLVCVCCDGGDIEKLTGII